MIGVVFAPTYRLVLLMLLFCEDLVGPEAGSMAKAPTYQIGFPAVVKLGLGVMVVGGAALYVRNRSRSGKPNRSTQTLP